SVSLFRPVRIGVHSETKGIECETFYLASR
ncbi:MAG: hypothetical protein ACJAU0_001442, partial [Flavobacteriales bacterium]